jgi:soluble lytic murein transglycosylase-like protein
MTKLLRLIPGAVSPGRYFDLDYWRASVVMALTAPLTALLVVVLSASSAPYAPTPVAAVRPSSAMAAPTAIDTTRSERRIAPGRSENIEALASVIARKYRVSEEAIRGLIAAAYREGVRNGLDPLLLIAVIAVESRFNPIAQSDGGAVGLMQVIPRYHADKLDASAGSAVLDPHTNIHVGARILKEYISRGGNEVAGLQLYNGSSADATNAYANRVLGEKHWLQDAMKRSKERVHA